MEYSRNIIKILPILIVASCCLPVSADQNSLRVLDEIIVTARKQEESLLDVPVSVSNLSEQTLRNYNLDNMQKIAESIPQLKISKAATGGSGAIFSIRGIGTTPLDAGLGQSVALIIDDTPGNQGNLVSLGFFDLDRVEVLKGPQALFFGKNSPAGVISFVSKGPGDELEGYVKTSYEFEADETIIEGAVGGPLSDTLGVRVAGRYRDLDGYTKNNATAVIDPIFGVPVAAPDDSVAPIEEDWIARITAVWTPTDDLTATIKFVGSQFEANGDQSLTTQLTCAPGQTTPTTLGIPDPVAACKFGQTHTLGQIPDLFLTGVDHTKSGGEPFTEQDTYIGSLKLEYSSSNFDLTSVTSYTKYLHRNLDNSTGGSYTWFWGLVDDEFESYSQEFRLNTSWDGPLNFTVGAYYEEMELLGPSQRSIGPLPPDPVTGRFIGQKSEAEIEGETQSVFFQARYEISEDLEFAAGARYTHDEKKISKLGNTWVNPFAVGFLAPAGIFQEDSFSDNNWSPEISLTYNMTDDLMVYAAYKTGYKGGGFGMPAVITAVQTAESISFDSEESKGGEIGFKGELYDRTLRLQGAIFYYEFEDLQSVAFDSSVTSFDFSNAGSATTEGIELDFEWAATNAMTLRGAVSYSEGRYDDYSTAFCFAGQAASECTFNASVNRNAQDLSDERLPQSSDWEASLGLSYDMPIGNDYNLVFYTDISYRSEYNVSDINIPGTDVDGFYLVNAGARFGSAGGDWELAIYGRNLTDEFEPTYAVDKAGGAPGEVYALGVSRPREVAVELLYRF